MAVLLVWQSTTETIDDALATFDYDVEVALSRAYADEQTRSAVALVPVAADAQLLGGDPAPRVRPGPAKGEGNNVSLLALPARTSVVRPTLLAGRWLLPEDENAVVVNTSFLRDEPDVELGDEVTFRVDAKETTSRVVGMVRGVMSGPIVYANQPYYWHLTNSSGRGATLRVVGSASRSTCAGGCPILDAGGPRRSRQPIVRRLEPARASSRRQARWRLDGWRRARISRSESRSRPAWSARARAS